MKYTVINAEDGKTLFESEDRAEAFKKARELNGEHPGEIYVEDSDDRVYEDLATF